MNPTLKFMGLCLFGVIVCICTAIVWKGTTQPSSEVPPAVENGRGGAVSQVQEYLKATANDADSIKYLEWSRVEKTRHGYSVRCKFRAKNAFGAYILHNKVFEMTDTGAVFQMRDD
jgi:hypothetical protein